MNDRAVPGDEGLADDVGCERWHVGVGKRHQVSTSTDEPHWRRSGLDLQPAVTLRDSGLTHRRSRNMKEQVIGAVLFGSAAVSTLVTVGVVLVLLSETIAFFGEVSIVEFLADRGASFFRDIYNGTGGGDPLAALDHLWDLVWLGHVTNDTLAPVRALIQHRSTTRSGRPGLSSQFPPQAAGRWSLTEALRSEVPSTESLHALAVTLLERHGVVTREGVRSEGVAGGFAAVYPVLKAMEEEGYISEDEYRRADAKGHTGAATRNLSQGPAVPHVRAHRGLPVHIPGSSRSGSPPRLHRQGHTECRDHGGPTGWLALRPRRGGGARAGAAPRPRAAPPQGAPPPAAAGGATPGPPPPRPPRPPPPAPAAGRPASPAATRSTKRATRPGAGRQRPASRCPAIAAATPGHPGRG